MPRKQLPPRLIEAGGVWYVAFHADGRSQRQSLRTPDLHEAQARFQGWLDAHRAHQADAADLTLRHAFRLYIEQHGPTTASPETLEHVSKPLIVWFGDQRITSLSRSDIERYTRERQAGAKGKRAVSAGTVRKELTILRAVWNFMVKKVEPKESRVPANELCYIPLPPKSPPRNRVLTEGELATIRRHAPITELEKPARISVFLWLLMETGARSEALRTLEWSQVDVARGIIHLNPWGRHQTTKRRPVIPMSDDLAAVLTIVKRHATTDYVCDHPGAIRKSLDRFLDRLGLHDVTAHTFRHTLATRMAERGVEMRDIAAMLGDSVATVEKNYLHLSPHYLKGALAKVKVAA